MQYFALEKFILNMIVLEYMLCSIANGREKKCLTTELTLF